MPLRKRSFIRVLRVLNESRSSAAGPVSECLSTNDWAQAREAGRTHHEPGDIVAFVEP